MQGCQDFPLCCLSPLVDVGEPFQKEKLLETEALTLRRVMEQNNR